MGSPLLQRASRRTPDGYDRDQGRGPRSPGKASTRVRDGCFTTIDEYDVVYVVTAKGVYWVAPYSITGLSE